MGIVTLYYVNSLIKLSKDSEIFSPQHIILSLKALQPLVELPVKCLRVLFHHSSSHDLSGNFAENNQGVASRESYLTEPQRTGER